MTITGNQTASQQATAVAPIASTSLQHLRIGILTSGADAPGMNACIRAIARISAANGVDVIGIPNGFEGFCAASTGPSPRGSVEDTGPIETTQTVLWEDGLRPFYFFNRAFVTEKPAARNRKLMRQVSMIIHRGGSILLSGRYPKLQKIHTQAPELEKIRNSVNFLKLTHLIIIGGKGSMTAAYLISQDLHKNQVKCRILGIPASIENDLYGLSDSSIGYDTALNTSVCCIDRIRDTGEAMLYTHFVEVAGTDSALLSAEAALAAGAEIVYTRHESTSKITTQWMEANRLDDHQYDSHSVKRKSRLVIVSESAALSHVTSTLREQQVLKNNSDQFETKLGQMQRGGIPTARDRIVATLMGQWVTNAVIHDAMFPESEYAGSRGTHPTQSDSGQFGDKWQQVHIPFMASMDGDRLGWAQLVAKRVEHLGEYALEVDRQHRISDSYVDPYPSDQSRADHIQEIVKHVSRDFFGKRSHR